MKIRRLSWQALGALVPLVLAGTLTGFAPGETLASAGENWTVVPSPSLGNAGNGLNGVAATSASNAWAVGSFGGTTGDQSLIEHWNGSAWAVVPSPSLGNAGNSLNGVAATSASNAWAVGARGTSATHTLIEHWNGSRWAVVPSPNPGAHGNDLLGVTATSASNAWAVGWSYDGTNFLTLIEHWNGSTWAVVPSPDPAADNVNILRGVAATSASNAWAVGYYTPRFHYQTLIEHWNGTSWTVVPSPDPGFHSQDNFLNGVAATSPSNAWAVGHYIHNYDPQTLIAHWGGTSWRPVPSPNPGSVENSLDAVAATSASNAWAVGFDDNAVETDQQTLIAHWDGSAWVAVPSPDPGNNGNFLNGVAATSATDAWAVGQTAENSNVFHALALHCC